MHILTSKVSFELSHMSNVYKIDHVGIKPNCTQTPLQHNEDQPERADVLVMCYQWLPWD